MIKSLFKKVVPVLAKEAVELAEKTIGKGKGDIKKEIAIRYILDVLPFPNFIEKLMFIFLKGLIEESIEQAVKLLEQTEKEQVL